MRGQLLSVAEDGSGTVAVDAGVSCARCARGQGCGALALASASAPVRLRCHTCGPLRAGTPVALDAPGDAGWLLPVLLAYGLPTLGLLAGSLAPEPWTPLGAIAGLGGGLLAWRVASARLDRAAEAGPCSLVARTRPFDDERSADDATAVAVAASVPGNRSLPSEEPHA